MTLPKPPAGYPKPVAISYRRFSSPKQGKGDSLRRQGEPAEIWSKRYDVPLDLSLAFDDKGKSAFRGKNAEFGELRAILQLIRDGERIWPGCYLLIENLDRLSRQNLFAGLAIIQQILEAGVRIVTFMPERVYTSDCTSDQGAILEMVLILMRAHDESMMKSKRCGAAWANKRTNAKTEKLSKHCPAWLEPVIDASGTKVVKFRKISERVAVVRRMYRLRLEGLGNRSVCSTLNRDGVETFGTSKRWTVSTVGKYLSSRAVLGEFQPCKMSDDGRLRLPDGPPVADYFPAIVDEEMFDEVAALRTASTQPRGPRSGDVTNIFVGLLYDATDGESLVVRKEGRRVPQPIKIFNHAASELQGGSRVGFSYEPFELSILALVKSLDLSSVAMNTRGLSKQIATAARSVRTIEAKLDDLTASARDAARVSTARLDLIDDTSAKLDDAREQLDALMRQQSSTADIALRSAKSLGVKLKSCGAIERSKIRNKLRALLPQFITRIDVLIVELNSSDRAAICSVELISGKTTSLSLVVGAGSRTTGDTTLPAELLGLDVLDYKHWPKRWRTQRLSIPSDRDLLMIERRGDGLSYAELGDEFEMTKASAHKIIQKWGRAG